MGLSSIMLLLLSMELLTMRYSDISISVCYIFNVVGLFEMIYFLVLSSSFVDMLFSSYFGRIMCQILLRWEVHKSSKMENSLFRYNSIYL